MLRVSPEIVTSRGFRFMKPLQLEVFTFFESFGFADMLAFRRAIDQREKMPPRLITFDAAAFQPGGLPGVPGSCEGVHAGGLS